MIRFIPFDITLEYQGKTFAGIVRPLPPEEDNKEVPTEFNITLNNEDLGTIKCTSEGWQGLGGIQFKEFIDKIGDYITRYYQ